MRFIDPFSPRDVDCKTQESLKVLQFAGGGFSSYIKVINQAITSNVRFSFCREKAHVRTCLFSQNFSHLAWLKVWRFHKTPLILISWNLR